MSTSTPTVSFDRRRLIPAMRPPAEAGRHLWLAWVISHLLLLLSAVMLADSLLLPLPGEQYVAFNRLSQSVGSGMFLLSASAAGMLRLGWSMAGRMAVVLYGILLIATMSAVMGRGTGVDVIGSVCLICVPALIFAPEERAALIISLILAVGTIIGIQWWLWFGNPLIPIEMAQINAVRAGVVAVGIAVGLFIIFLHYSAERAKRDLTGEKARSDALLLNILPASVAERLKRDEEIIADGCPEVTILFADIVGFTQFSANRSPAQVIDMLNTLFSRFDDLCALHGVEKIKTIGDGYVAAAGLPEPRSDHVQAVANLALDMQAAMREYRRTMPEVDLRIGINCGPVVAGVIGKRKFAYDMWGDSVNTASRLETASQPGRITVSAAIRDRLGDAYRFEERGLVSLKGKGDMPVWFLNGKADA